MGLYQAASENLDSISSMSVISNEFGIVEGYNKIRETLDHNNQITGNNAHSSYNVLYHSEVRSLLAIDQAIRNRPEIYLEFGDKWEAIRRIDSINIQSAAQLIKTYGFPDESIHGFDASPLILLFLHSCNYSLELFNQITSLISLGVEQCRCKKASLALVYDARSETTSSGSRYGVYNFKDRFTELEFPKEVDLNRFEMNLLSLKDYSIIRGLPIPEGYEELGYPAGYFCVDIK